MLLKFMFLICTGAFLHPSFRKFKFKTKIETPHIRQGVLSQSITELQLSPLFNQPITVGILPSSLTTLYFGYKFNQLIEPYVLPQTLTILYFGNNSYFD